PSDTRACLLLYVSQIRSSEISQSARRSVAGYISLVSASSFPRHPLPDISRTVQHSDAVRLASVEELNPVEVDKGHLFNVQYRRGPAALNLSSDLIQILGSKVPAEPNSLSGSFNL